MYGLKAVPFKQSEFFRSLFSRWGTLFETYRAKSGLFAAAFATDVWKTHLRG